MCWSGLIDGQPFRTAGIGEVIRAGESQWAASRHDPPLEYLADNASFQLAVNN